MPAEGSPFSDTTRVLAVDVTPARADDVAEALRALIERLPAHPGIIPVHDAGVAADGHPFIVTPTSQGEPLDVALSTYGPAALADALPRLQQLADALDHAAQHDLCHGALTPADIMVAAEDTSISGIGVSGALRSAGVSLPFRLPYAAPERLAGEAETTSADQYALAAIAHEWLFGRVVDVAALAKDGVRLPGVSSQRLTSAFATALADTPHARFARCSDFVAAVAVAASGVDQEAGAEEAELPLNMADEETQVPPYPPAPAAERRWGAVPLGAALLAGLAAGGVVVWLLAARGNSVPVAPEQQVQPAVAERPGAEPTVREVTESVLDPAPDIASSPSTPQSLPSTLQTAPVAAPSRVGGAAPATKAAAGLLIHSTPAGAMVTVDGALRGTTPVTIRGLAFGTTKVVVSRPGYRSAEQQVVLTADRPSRALEVELSPARTAAPPAAGATGTVVVDTRPAGAAVVINGRAAGVTPLTVTLPVGQHTVRLERPGYRTVSSRVPVKAGERARVAARLEGGQDEE